jgi:cytochrome b6-f complex iron-sulfur subunit
MPVITSEAEPDASIKLLKSGSKTISRHEFLTFAWKSMLGLSGLLGLIGLQRYLSFQPDPPPVTQFDLGFAKDFPLGSRVVINEAQAVIQNTPQGFQAYSLVCPHLGCIVDLSENGFACPCHGSRFDPEGNLVHGPADRPLRTLTTEISQEGHLILNTEDNL